MMKNTGCVESLEIKNRIRHIRREKRLSGIEVAKSLGISSPYLYDIEKGERRLSADIATQLAEIFDVTTDYLLGRSEEKEQGNNSNEIQNQCVNDELTRLRRENEKLISQINHLKEAIKNLTKGW